MTKRKVRKCKVRGCGGEHLSKGFCSEHYHASYREANKDKINAYRSANRATINEKLRVYRRTFDGMLTTIYSGMRTRVRGPWHTAIDRKLYKGRYLPPREEFLNHARNTLEVHRLYKQWVASGYATDMKPSPDRDCSDPDPKTGFTGGYELTNITFKTWKMNRDAARFKHELNNKKAAYDTIGQTLRVEGRTSVHRKRRPREQQAIYDVAGVSRRKHEKKRRTT